MDIYLLLGRNPMCGMSNTNSGMHNENVMVTKNKIWNEERIHDTI